VHQVGDQPMLAFDLRPG